MQNYVDNPFNTPSILSFCPGVRGLERGLERAIGGVKTLAHVEIEAFIVENLASQMEQGLLAPAPIWSNLKTFDALPFRGKVHGYIGGYPCQPFSNAGQRGGKEDPRHLWPYIRQHISTGRPIWCFFENVAGHLTLGYEEVYRDLRDLGYSVETGIYSAEEIGAPQQRERLFILALDDSCGIRPEQIHEILSGWNGAINAGKNELAYTDSNGHHGSENGQSAFEGGHRYTSGENNVFEPAGRSIESEHETLAYAKDERNGGLSECEPGQERSEQVEGNDVERGSEEQLADSTGFGVQGNWGEGEQEPGGHVEETVFECHGGRDKWPAKPGEEPYSWEEPRSVKSGLGCTAHGYNFREDLLRALGNSVVEQTSEVAFIGLLKKHYEARTKHIISEH